MDRIGGTSSTSVSAQKTSSQMLHFRKGQIFEGQVLKLFPNQTAALRLGTMNVTARLEAALSAGERYFFQVKQNEGVPRLKVLETKNTALKAEGLQTNISSVLQVLDLSDHKTNQTMVRLFQKEQMPFSKEMIAKGGEILNKANALHQDGVKILSMINQKQLPMTLAAFQSLFEAEHGPSLSAQIQKLASLLEQALAQPRTNGEAAAVKELMQHVNNTMGLFEMRRMESSEAAKTLIHLFRLSGHSNESVKEGAMSLLQRINILPPSIGTEEGLQTFKNQILMKQEEIERLWPGGGQKSIEALKGMAPKDVFQTIMTELPSLSGDKRSNILSFLHSIAHGSQQPLLTEEQLMTMVHKLHQLAQDSVLSTAEKQVISVLLQNGLMDVGEGGQRGASVAKQFAALMEQLGLQHESLLAKQMNTSNIRGFTPPPDSLKQALLQQIPHLPSMVQDSAEALLHKVTGQQLQMQEQNGPLQQAVLQLPLQLGGHQTDLTVQWEGKKREDGSFHPDHCRMLFYLHMEHLGETIADVHIQNRHVLITVFNEREKPTALVNMLQPVLKKKLSAHDYTLSSVTWKQVGENKKITPKEAYPSYAGWEGVDIRV